MKIKFIMTLLVLTSLGFSIPTRAAEKTGVVPLSTSKNNSNSITPGLMEVPESIGTVSPVKTTHENSLSPEERIQFNNKAPVSMLPESLISASPGSTGHIRRRPDIDGDGIGDMWDNCPENSNPIQTDSDRDGIGDVCDNCIDVPNADQSDFNNDRQGDACQDTDVDMVMDFQDNCPEHANTDQVDRNGNGIGDVCDTEDCPDPEVRITVGPQRCEYYRSDPCDTLAEGSCHTIRSYPAPIIPAPDGINRERLNNSTYSVSYTTRFVHTLEDSCNRLNTFTATESRWYGTAEQAIFRANGWNGSAPRRVNFDGDRGSVSFKWTSDRTYLYQPVEGEYLLFGLLPGQHHERLSFMNYLSGTRFETSLRRVPLSIAEHEGNGYAGGTWTCRVHASGVCGKFVDVTYNYRCAP